MSFATWSDLDPDSRAGRMAAGSEPSAALEGPPGASGAASRPQPTVCGHAERFRLELTTRGGVHHLARVVNVLALMGVTPTEIRGVSESDGMRIVLLFHAPPRQAQMCAARLGALVVVEQVVAALAPPD